MTPSANRSASPPPTVRIAHAPDLDQAARIKAAGGVEMNQRLHPLLSSGGFDEEESVRNARAILAALMNEDADQVWVAAHGSEVIAVASAAFRDRNAHIQSFFVAPDHQQRGIGSRLFAALLAAGRNAECTAFSLQSSDDPRALALYLKHGFRLGPPNVVWATANFHRQTHEFGRTFEAAAINRDDPATMNTVGDIDKAVRGAKRLGDLGRWLNEGATGSLLKDRETGNPAGYFLVSAKRDQPRIGPVAAIDESLFPDVLAAAFAAAARYAPGMGWSMALPGQNQNSVAPLLAAGFRPLFLLPFLTTAPFGQFDRYAFRDLDFL